LKVHFIKNEYFTGKASSKATITI